MVRMANVPGDGVVVDLGAGDGRLLVAARKAVPSCSAVGFEAHEGRAEGLRALAGLTVQQMKIQDAIESRQQILQVADVVFLYLLDSSNLAIRDGLRSVMKPGARIVSHDFAMGDWEPSAAETVFADDRTHKVYRWVV
jgi:precorrin-6B methylase 2